MAMGQQASDPAGDAPQGVATLIARQPKRTMAILAISLIGWVFLAWIALDRVHLVAQLMMPGSPEWSAASALAIWSMWALIMAAMMLPSALPMILTFVHLARRNGEQARARSFAAAYLLVWFAFSAAATAAQWMLQAMDWVDPMIVSTSAL